jgi:hypothetical protein
LTDVSEEFPDGGGSKLLRNFGQYLPDDDVLLERDVV